MVVAGDAGAPRQFIWWGEVHPVAEITRHWRLNADWWRHPVWRDHFKLTTETGLLVIIYHDLEGDSWYLQRLYD